MKVELARYAKNYLPILFNLYCKKPENEQDKKRNAYLATVTAYLPVTQQEVTSGFFCVFLVSHLFRIVQHGLPNYCTLFLSCVLR